MKTYRVLGLMSGTSLDGLDMALCHFQEENEKWSYQIEKAVTVPYSKHWKRKLEQAHTLNAFQLIEFHNEFGRNLGKSIQQHFSPETYDFIASHGHTVFHQTDMQLTLQIGNGACIAAQTGKTCINDFRTLDVALNGQGAPLVPIGDRLLFSDYDYCLNLGGIANISYEENGKRKAFDICPVNMPFNFLCSKYLNIPFDKNGTLAKSGQIDQSLLTQLSALSYYKQEAPKSLGREWFEDKFMPILEKSEASLNNKLRTLIEHICLEISKHISADSKILVTGGGAHNAFLIQELQKKSKAQVIVPEKDIVDYKEALVFAFLGVLRFRNENNCLASVTGAEKDSCGGIIHWMD